MPGDLTKDDLNRFCLELVEKLEAFVKDNGGRISDEGLDELCVAVDKALDEAFPNADYTNYN